jgi:hypothetical protein
VRNSDVFTKVTRMLQPTGKIPPLKNPFSNDRPVKPLKPGAPATVNRLLKKTFDSQEASDFAARVRAWQDSPELFAQEVLGIGVCDCGCTLTNQQRLILRDLATLVKVKEKLWKKEPLTQYEEKFRDKIGISVKAGKGTGKTTVMAIAHTWFNSCFGTRVKSMATAPRIKALKDNLFSELSLWLTHSRKVYGSHSFADKLLGLDSLKLYRKLIYKPDGTLDKEAIGKQGVLHGVTCSRNADEAAQKATLQGYHDVYQLISADESYGIPSAVFEPLETTCTRQVNIAFLIGNPTKNSGYAYDTFNKNKKYWICHTMNAEESELVSEDHIKRLKEKYKDYPNLYRVNVLGEHPVDGDGSLIPFNKISAAVERYEELTETDPRFYGKPVVMGLDVGAGKDPTVLYRRQGIKVDLCGRFSHSDTMVIARWAATHFETHNPTKVGVDGLTWGKGTFDKLRELGYRDICTFVDARRKASDKKRYKNLRAEIIFTLVEQFINDNIAIPNDDELISQLSIIRTADNSDLIQIMSKPDMRSEGIDSPNDLDCLAFTYYFSENRLEHVQRESVDHRYSLEDDYGRPNGWMAA